MQSEDDSAPHAQAAANVASEVVRQESPYAWLLAYRSFGTPVPEEISNFMALDDPNAKGAGDAGVYRARAGDAPDRQLFGSRAPQSGTNRRERENRGDRGDRVDRGDRGERRQEERVIERARLPPPSETAYRVAKKETTSREQELQRAVQSLLNKICPENVKKIGSQIAETKVVSTAELKLVIGLIMKKSLSEPHYCETYADLVYLLKAEMPEFPCPDGGPKPVSFKSTLLNFCQNEFDCISTIMEETEDEADKYNPEELDFIRNQRKTRVLANMKFIGHLFLRGLLTPKIIGQVIEDLSCCKQEEVLPADYVVECLCELLTSIGYTLESMPAGAAALGQVCGRLKDLKTRKLKNGKSVYCKRIQFGIQDLLDIRSKGWERKVFKTIAKTKDEIRQAQEQDMKAQAVGSDVSSGVKVIAGQRPAYLTGGKAGAPGDPQAKDDAWTEVPKTRKGR